MYKVIIIGKEKGEIEPLVTKLGFIIVNKNPNIVISYGGDGTILKSEFLLPGVPKVILKNSQICKKCSGLTNEEILEKIKKGKFTLQKHWKLEAMVKNQILYALNEIVVRNQDFQHCIRYQVFIDKKEVRKEVIGDGLVVATPFGSTAYYKSITDSSFEVGIGLAFNNSTEQDDHIVLKENRKIQVKIIRGPALVYADTQPGRILLKSGEEILIQKTAQVAQIIVT